MVEDAPGSSPALEQERCRMMNTGQSGISDAGLLRTRMAFGRRRPASLRLRGFLAGLIVVVVTMVSSAVSAAVSAAAGADDKAAQAGQFISTLAEQAVAALTASDISPEEREKRSRQLLKDHFAVRAIGQWVLGRYWRTATPEERDQYLRLFEDLIVVTYVDRFKRYSGEKLTVVRSLVDADSGDAVVYSEIIRPNADKPVSVAWRVRAQEGDLKVVDVFVEGVSLSQTQRAEFTSTLSRNNGDMQVLLREMQDRISRQT
jgi:phospholipid transport system substrate-binding protein